MIKFQPFWFQLNNNAKRRNTNDIHCMYQDNSDWNKP